MSPRERQRFEKEYVRQLQDQENGINKLTVGQYLSNRQKYENLKRGGVSNGTAQADLHRRFENNLERSIERSARRRGQKLTPAELSRKVAERKQGLAALHNPDLKAGGFDRVTRMGRADVNSSIGPQWRARVGAMDKYAEELMAREGPNARMNVKLNRCR